MNPSNCSCLCWDLNLGPPKHQVDAIITRPIGQNMYLPVNISTRPPKMCITCEFVENSVLSQVMESEEFLLLPDNQLVDIISSDELNVRSEEQVYSAVVNWVKYSLHERRPHLPTVRRCLVFKRSEEVCF